jgi:homoserine kinase
VQVPGSTSNLGSGFDTFSAALSLYLTVSVESISGRATEWPTDWSLAPGDNMIEKAFRKTCETLGLRTGGLRFLVRNEIPFKRGLGSSGAAIIAGIKLAERLAQIRLTPEETFQIAYPLEGHPDNIAASLLGGWVASRVENDSMAAECLESRLDVKFVVAIPDQTVSTQEAREILPGKLNLSDAVFNVQRAALFVHALGTGRIDLLRPATEDRLHQCYRASLIPGLSELLIRNGLPRELEGELLSITVSGSGSTVLAIARSACEPIGDWMVRVLAGAGVSAQYKILDLDEDGARLIG